MATPLSIPVRPTGQPQWPFGVNWGSWEAQGLTTWIPLGTAPVLDLIGGGGLISRQIPTRGRVGNIGNSYGNPRTNTQTMRVANALPVNYKLTLPLTMSFWVVLYQLGTTQVIVALLDNTNANTTRCTIGTTGAINAIHTAQTPKVRITSNLLGVGRPYHIAWTDDDSLTGTNLHVYLNGEECGYSSTTDGSGTITNTLGPISILGDASSANVLNGALMDCRLYDYPMSAYQIGMLYENVAKYDLYQQRRILISVPVTSTFLPRLAVLGAG